MHCESNMRLCIPPFPLLPPVQNLVVMKSEYAWTSKVDKND
jgi:hypothetical protein